MTLIADRITQSVSAVKISVIGQRFSDWEGETWDRLKVSNGDNDIPIRFAPLSLRETAGIEPNTVDLLDAVGRKHR